MLYLEFFGFTSVIPIILGFEMATLFSNSVNLFIKLSAFVYKQVNDVHLTISIFAFVLFNSTETFFTSSPWGGAGIGFNLPP